MIRTLLLLILFISACSKQEVITQSGNSRAEAKYCREDWNGVCEDYPYTENTNITDLTTCEMGKRGFFDVGEVIRAKDANKFCETYLYMKEE